MMRTALFALGGAAAALAVVLLANTATYHSRQIPAEPAPAMALDTAAAAERLARALRFRTISFGGASGVDTTPFHDLQLRSEERRVGKECRCRGWAGHAKKKAKAPDGERRVARVGHGS